MRCNISHLAVLFILAVLSSDTRALKTLEEANAEAACREISSVISIQSAVFLPGSSQYEKDTSHYAASSSQRSACSVEPGNVDDIAKILRVIARDRVPFAVKGGGHTMNRGFSSTLGIHIAMSRFSEINYKASSQTVDVGAGLVFDDVYDALEPHGANVVGGRVSGIGVAGFTLGGGLSWLSNERGLALDNVLAFGLVLPNGTYANVTQSSYPELFFGLKGSFNNFGIVVKFTLKVYPQGQVWGGSSLVLEDHFDQVNAATSKFTSLVQDPKAGLITSYSFSNNFSLATLLLFYNDPTPPPGVFDDFLAIPAFQQNISTQSFASLIRNQPGGVFSLSRGVFDTVSLTSHSETFLKAVINETLFWGGALVNEPGFVSSYAVEPFQASAFNQASVDSSAFPPTRNLLFPSCITYSWSNSTSDARMHEAIKESTKQLALVAEAEGQDIADLPIYGNYAIFGTSIDNIYGQNVEKLQRIKQQFDPDNVMGLTGGWRF